MKVLVTGITGFLGQYLAEHLLDCGDEVLGLSRRGFWRNEVEQHLRSIPLYAWDVTSPISEDVAHAVSEFRPDAIVHLAAISSPGECGRGEPNELAQQTNVLGTESLLNLGSQVSSVRRFLFVSSCHVYSPVDRDNPIVTEDSPLGPINGYGMTKLAAEKAVFSRNVEFETIVARGFQHTGPRQPPRYMVPEWAKQLAEDSSEPIRVKCLQSLLDLSDARDVVRAYRDLLRSGRAGQAYNVGSGIARLSGSVLTEMRKILSDLKSVSSARAIVELSNQPQTNPIADLEKIESESGWQPEVLWGKTLADTLQYWLNQG